MDTIILSDSNSDIAIAARMIRKGLLVCIPTETVYGLGADALNEEAVRNVFVAKGRPADNPLIVHLSNFSQAEKFTLYIPKLAYKLAKRFCPGPLTMVLPKSNCIPMITSGGLNTVGIRVPSHPIMHRIIELSGCPIAAPSANISGFPSPTNVAYVMRDMNGRISAVVDGGISQFGIESTIISFSNDNNSIRILRPGVITREMLLKVCNNVIIDPAILEEIKSDAEIASPGMKYKHYSPKANVIMVEGSIKDFTRLVSKNYDDNVYSLIFDSDVNEFPFKHLTYGSDSLQQAHFLFQRLRELDDMGADVIYARAPLLKDGIGFAVYNRLIKAAGFNVLRI